MKRLVVLTAVLGFVFVGSAQANHQWGNLHWARASNPFTISLDDRTTGDWAPYNARAASLWSQSSVLDMALGNGTRIVTVSNGNYGANGWVGLATISYEPISGHILGASAQYNEYYTANDPKWGDVAGKQYITCHEIGHTTPLNHPDIFFGNTNLGSCLDYTDSPAGGGKFGPPNLQPNAHDFDVLEQIYTHTDQRSKGNKPPRTVRKVAIIQRFFPAQ